MFCLNLCEILSAAALREGRLGQVIRRVKERNGIEEALERIYAGSSFCSQYFMHINFWEPLAECCRENGWRMTLTLPVFSQKDLEPAKKRIDEILDIGQKAIDEVTVNDLGMLHYVPSRYDIKINLGRLFFKDSRDVRVKGYREGRMAPALLSSRSYMLMGADRIHGIELDTMSRYIDVSGCDLEGVSLGVHGPFCYMSTGNICKYASIHKKPEQKFRPNAACGMECAKLYEHYRARFAGRDTDMLRYGRTIYYYNNDSRIIGKKIDRKIYFPALELGYVMKEGGADEGSRSVK